MSTPETLNQSAEQLQLPETIEVVDASAPASIPQETIDLSDPIVESDESGADDAAPWGYKADGTPRAKPGRRKSSEAGGTDQTHARLNSVGTPPPRKPRPAPQLSASPAPAPIAVNYQALGRLGATVFFASGEGIFGPDWAPEQNEPEEIAGAFAAYFEAQQMTDLPPGWALAIALGGYALKRVNKPTVKERAFSAWVWIKGKFRRG